MVDLQNQNRPDIPLSLGFYTGFTTALIPLLHITKPLLALYGGFKDTVGERLGKFSPALDDLEKSRGDKPLLWIHAVSVGETSVAKVLVEAIKSRRPDCLVAISCTTFTGRDYILKNFKPDALFFFPLDIYGVMKRLVEKLKPTCFLDIEIELWPNTFRVLKEAGVPMALANGRISDRAAAPPIIARGMYKWLYQSLDALFMRSGEDVERAVKLGAPEDRTYLAGNLKFASCGEPPSDDERSATRKILNLGETDKLLVAGSTHPGEDELLIEAWKELKDGLFKDKKLKLVLTPRHLEQVERIADLVRAAGEKIELWTEIKKQGRLSDGVDAVVVNTIGELMSLYGASDAAFVGGSLVERGGHNVLEPVAVGIPTMHGPSMANFHDLKKIIGAEGLLYEVNNSKDLASTTAMILTSVDRGEYLTKARDLISKQMQAQDIIADWVVSNF